MAWIHPYPDPVARRSFNVSLENGADKQRVQNIRVSSEGRRIDGFISLCGAISQVRTLSFH